MNIMPAAYRDTDSHPYHQNHTPFPHYNQPQMNLDPSKALPAYEQTWPYTSNHCYPSPMQFCCGHHRFPGYWTYTPAYPPHIPTSSPMCFSGNYPSYPEPFYVPYAPPPHYSMELPRYEYDKSIPKEYHCCGCPNHPLSHREGNSVKIEEHEPDSEKKVYDSVSPSQLKNYPCPFVWIPPQFMDNKEVKKPGATEVGDQHVRMPLEKVRNGWFPLDINNLANIVQAGNGRTGKNWQIDNGVKEVEDGKTNSNQLSERNKREFPFPVIWIPSYNMQESEKMQDQERNSLANSVKEVPRVLDSSANCVEEESRILDSAPVVSHPSHDASNRSNVNRNDSEVVDSDVPSKEMDEKGIPIKQMELQRSEPESHEKRVRDIPVKQIEGNVTEKETQTSVKRQSSPPKKTSKLPPVCLRVDPLPRKRNGNGSSRSPSSSKKGSAESTHGTPESSSSSSSFHDKALEDAKEQRGLDVNAELKPREKTVEVVDTSSEKKGGEQIDSNNNGDFKPKSKSIKVLEKSSEKKPEDHIDGTQSQVTSNANAEVHKDSSPLASTCEKVNGNEAERKVNDIIKEEEIGSMDAKDVKERKVLSDTEAAALIQAAYRGFMVRKWEPLKKLKQIAEVSKHVTDVEGSIQALEASSNEQIVEKERVTIGETIMRLLLKLDAIQGLHPSFREMRKSLARELTSLQEKLDSIVAKKSRLLMEDQSMEKLKTSTDGSNGENIQEKPEEVSMPRKDSSECIIQKSLGSLEQQAEEIAASKNSSDSIMQISRDMVEQGQDQFSAKNDKASHDDEEVQSLAHILPVDDGMQKPESLPEETINEADDKFSETEAAGCDISELQPKTKPELEDVPNEADELQMKAWEELPQGVIEDDLEAENIDLRKDKENEIEGEELQISKATYTPGDDFAQDGDSSKMHEMKELQIGLLEDDTANSEKHEESEISAQVLKSEEGEWNQALLNHSLSEELPVGLLDDDDAADSEKHEETGTLAQVLQDEGGECNPALLTHSLETQLDHKEEKESNGESDDWVKVEFEQDGLQGDASVNSKVENDERFVNEDACLEMKEVTVIETPKEEEVAVKEEQSEQVIKDDAENKEVLSEKMDTDRNLIEENEKLRKMMQKLLEAGNEQLTVISNLTGRVKELEKKLAKKKRVKTRHCRPTSSKSSFKKSSDNQLHDRTTGVAM